MFTVQVGEKEYRVSFEHQPEGMFTLDSQSMDDGCHFRYTPPQTLCKVYTGPKESPDQTIGVATLHPNDRYVKAIGRKISMTHALQEMFPEDKTTRKLFWDAYLNRVPKLTPS